MIRNGGSTWSGIYTFSLAAIKWNPPLIKLNKRKLIPNHRQSLKRARGTYFGTGLLIIFLISLILGAWGIGIYRRTIVEPKYLFGIAVLGTIIAAIILLFITREFLNAFLTLILASAIGGGTAMFLTLYLNRELSEREIISETFEIQRTGNLARGRSSNCNIPCAIIDFYGLEKQLVFYCEYEKTIHTFRKVKVDYSKGFFDFPIVRNKTPIP